MYIGFLKRSQVNNVSCLGKYIPSRDTRPANGCPLFLFFNAGYMNFAAVSVFGAAMIFLYAFVDLLYTKLAMIFRQELLTAGMV